MSGFHYVDAHIWFNFQISLVICYILRSNTTDTNVGYAMFCEGKYDAAL